jgi:hypothetical protein
MNIPSVYSLRAGYLTMMSHLQKLNKMKRGVTVYFPVYLLLRGEGRQPLWSSGQSSWLQIQKLGFDSQRYQIFCEVVGLERGPLSLMSTTEELLDRKVAAAV